MGQRLRESVIRIRKGMKNFLIMLLGNLGIVKVGYEWDLINELVFPYEEDKLKRVSYKIYDGKIHILFYGNEETQITTNGSNKTMGIWRLTKS